MSRSSYTPEFKAKIVLEVLQGERELGEIASENSIHPNLLRNWRKAFIQNASRAFGETRQAKEAQRKEESLEKEKAQMLETISQLTLERDFLQDCFRKSGNASTSLIRTDGSLSVRRQCELLNLRRSKLYEHPAQSTRRK